jgi:porin
MPNVPFPTYPNPALGISAQAIIKENLLIRVGLFDAKGKGGCWGFGTAFATDAHNVSALELDWRYWSSRRGSVKLGGWRRGGDCEVIGVSGSKSSNFGSYLILEQGILGNPENSGSCFDTFFQYGHAQDDRNDIPNYFGGGFTVKRLMKKRPDDVIGIGFACAVFNSKLASMEDETAIETFYLASVTNWLMVKPDVQYIMNPGGTEENAFVLGLRFFIAF